MIPTLETAPMRFNCELKKKGKNCAKKGGLSENLGKEQGPIKNLTIGGNIMVAVKCVGGVKLHNVSQLSTRDRLVFCFFSVCLRL